MRPVGEHEADVENDLRLGVEKGFRVMNLVHPTTVYRRRLCGARVAPTTLCRRRQFGLKEYPSTCKAFSRPIELCMPPPSIEGGNAVPGWHREPYVEGCNVVAEELRQRVRRRRGRSTKELVDQQPMSFMTSGPPGRCQ